MKRFFVAVVALAVMLAAAIVGMAGSAAAAPVQTLFAANAQPANSVRDSDRNSVELGLRFSARQNGKLTGLRLFRAQGMTQSHPVSLWTTGGTKLASATVPAASAVGWQSVTFATAVPLVAGTVYIASYHTAEGYPAQSDYFTGGATSQGSLTSATTNPTQNGVYTYSSGSVLPTSSYRSTNYFIDVRFVPGGGSTTTPPTSTSTSTTTAPPTTTPPTTTAPTTTRPSGGTPYVQPGSQGYQGDMGALTTYSAANGRAPSGCSWNQTYLYLDCTGTDLTLDHAYVQGGIYWRGCGNLNISQSVIDWAPSKTWHLIQAACQQPNSGVAYTITHTTLQTSPSVAVYTGGSDIGGLNEYTGSVKMLVSNSLIRGFPQGLDPGANSVIQDNEIYTQDAQCSGSVCHSDGLFSQGGNNITYQGNYISVQLKTPSTATAAIFFQSSPGSTGNKVIGNYLRGGSYTLYNETSSGVIVQNNTFAGAVYGDTSLSGGASWGQFTGNVHLDGSPVSP